MKAILNKLRENKEFYEHLKGIYGKTFGLWWLKTLYLKYVGVDGTKLVSQKKANEVISDCLKMNIPFMMCRYGSTEFRNLTNDKDFDLLYHYSGFFPKDPSLLKDFRKEYMKSSMNIDFLSVWNYKNHFFDKIALLKKLPNITYYFPVRINKIDENTWVNNLRGKKILVVHPFKKTIEQQFAFRKELGILPKLESLEVIKAVQTLADNEDNRFNNWFEALDYMKEQISGKDFDIALIGCGAYGLPIASHVKSLGKQAIHLGGGLQNMFGIIGKRWEGKIPMNEYWTRPLKEDFMKNYDKIEGGCYW